MTRGIQTRSLLSRARQGARRDGAAAEAALHRDLGSFDPAWREEDFILAFLDRRATAEVRVRVVQALSYSRTPETEQFLSLVVAARGVLPDAVRQAAAGALGRGRLSDSRPALVEVALDQAEAQELRMMCLRDLSGLRESRGVAHTILSRPDESDFIRGAAAELLGDLLHLTKLDRRVLYELLVDPSTEVRYWTAFALGESGNQQDVLELEKVLDDDAAIERYGTTVGAEAMDAIDSIRRRAREGWEWD